MTHARDRQGLRLTITRMSAVVVTAQGHLGGSESTRLQRILDDLIDGQGNLSIIVDLEDTQAWDASSLSVLAWAVNRSASRGGRLVLSHPPDDLHDALMQHSVDGLARGGQLGRRPASRER